MPPRAPQHADRRQHFPPPRAGASPLDPAVRGPAAGGSLHPPVLVREVLRCLSPRPADLVADLTLGGGGHAECLLGHIAPGGRLLGLDRDALELPRTIERLRTRGYASPTLDAVHASFADLRTVLDGAGIAAVDLVVADLGVSSMQHDTPSRGFNFRHAGPLDLRMDPTGGATAADLLAHIDAAALAALLSDGADEPHAARIAGALTAAPVSTMHGLVRTVRMALLTQAPAPGKAEVKASVRRTLQALRIAVNDEFTALDRLLDALPGCLAPGGRVVIITFHSGEDRRVKKSFQAGHRAGVYSAVAREALRSTREETYANRRVASAKLRWAIRSARSLPPSQ